jgi:WD40 repeat protein
VEQIRGENIGSKIEEFNQVTFKNLPYQTAALPSVGLLAVSKGKELVLIRIDDLKVLATALTMTTEEDSDIVAAFAPDGSFVAVAAEDGVLRVIPLDVTNPGPEVDVKVRSADTLKSSVPLGGKRMQQLAVHPGGKHVVACMEDGVWRVFRITDEGVEPEGEPLVGSAGPAAPAGSVTNCRCARFSADGSSLYTVHFLRRPLRNKKQYSYLTKWGVGVGAEGQLGLRVEELRQISDQAASCLNLSDDGTRGAVGDREGRLMLFSTSDLSFKVHNRMHETSVTDVSFSPGDMDNYGESVLVSTGADSTIRILRASPPSLLPLLATLFHVLFIIMVALLAFKFAEVYFSNPVATVPQLLDEFLHALPVIGEHVRMGIPITIH